MDEAAPEEWWRARDAPFPPEFAGEYSGRARIEQPVRRVFQRLPGSVTVGAEQGARYLWAGRDLGGEEAFKRWAQRLEERFPCRFSVSASGVAKPLPETAKSGKVHPWETGRDRTDGCRKATVACWEAADRQALRDAWRQRFGSAMPEALGRTFRVDMFGNVIADPESAAAKSVCAFEVDHIFPWSRGGGLYDRTWPRSSGEPTFASPTSFCTALSWVGGVGIACGAGSPWRGSWPCTISRRAPEARTGGAPWAACACG